MEPALTPYFDSSARIAETSDLPPGRSQSTCKAIVGLAPVNEFPCAASLNFSSIVVAAPACTNFPNRVPVLEKPHEGTSIRNPSRALHIFSVSLGDAPIIFILSSHLSTKLRKLEIYSLLKHHCCLQSSPIRWQNIRYAIRITSRYRGPCTPLIRVISMSAVADGPETKVVANLELGRSRSMASGTVSTTSSTRTRQR